MSSTDRRPSTVKNIFFRILYLNLFFRHTTSKGSKGKWPSKFSKDFSLKKTHERSFIYFLWLKFFKGSSSVKRKRLHYTEDFPPVYYSSKTLKCVWTEDIQIVCYRSKIIQRCSMKRRLFNGLLCPENS